ncbi:MAG: alpha/beta hydrolase, partial [Bdellovibrionales bacterium]|nr:alpha/beta hydrolase [Bdellovibrionales bacterium]
ADRRLYSEIQPINGYEFVDLEWRFNYNNIKTLKDYALELSKEIDTSQPFSLMGVSMGGMICSELADILNPKKVVIISSAKTNKELPPHFKRLKFLGLTRLLNQEKIRYVLANSSRFFGVMNKEQRKLFYEMAEGVDLDFIAWSIKAILNWDKRTSSPKIIHIHGTRDFVLPFASVNPSIIIEKGDHMMIWNKSKVINEKLKDIFC